MRLQAAEIRRLSCRFGDEKNETFDGLHNLNRGGVRVKAPRYKPAGRGFDSRWCHWNFSVT